jgi:hypothetical protein
VEAVLGMSLLSMQLLVGGKASTGLTGLGSATDVISDEQHHSLILMFCLLFFTGRLEKAQEFSVRKPGRRNSSARMEHSTLAYSRNNKLGTTQTFQYCNSALGRLAPAMPYQGVYSRIPTGDRRKLLNIQPGPMLTKYKEDQ